jgi:cell division protease FtsH
VRRLIDEAEAKAREILSKRIDDLHALAKALLEYETLSGDEVNKVLNGEKISRDEPGTKKSEKPASSVPVTGQPKRPRSGGGEMEPQPQG